MIIRIDPTGTTDGFRTILKEMSGVDDINGLLILACDENGFSPETVDDLLKSVSVPLFGGVFPGIIHDRKSLKRGTIVAGLGIRPSVHVIRGLSGVPLDYDREMAPLMAKTGKGKTIFVFVDGYSQGISGLIDSLYDNLGLQVNYLGGGAGSINPAALDMTKKPCLFTNDGLVKDSAVLAVTPMQSGVGAAHGWHKIQGPFKVTGSSGNAITSLDWRPAFEVYEEIISEHSGKTISRENFFDIAKCYPLGISRLGAEIIVRDPFTMEGDAIVVATEIPRESFIDILTGDRESIVEAAGKSRDAAMNAFRGRKKDAIMLIDCISRALFLGDGFPREIEAVCQDGVPLIGVLSLGEIANSGESFMELYNKTCVVGILGES